MTRPGFIRAGLCGVAGLSVRSILQPPPLRALGAQVPLVPGAYSIDLQDRDAPSTQGQHKPPADRSLAPHQAETLREVAAETAEERLRSPRISWVNGGDVGDLHQYAEDLAAGVTESLNTSSLQQQQKQQDRQHQQNGARNNMQAGPQQDALAIAQNGGLGAHQADDDTDMDGENEVDMDDDMMDKISSSPSIEDGGSTSTLPRVRLRRPGAPQASPTISDARSSSPYLEHPEYLPLHQLGQPAAVASPEPPRRHHHLHGEFGERRPTDQSSPPLSASYDPTSSDDNSSLCLDKDEACILEDTTKEDQDVDKEDVLQYPTRPSQLGGYDHDTKDLAIQDIGQDYDDYGLTVPYESDSDDDDDDGDFSSVADSRFLDSGWGGECLQDTEDIDFEFVYALHTFVATVEGQANATKGDTMVLLDDSNSYWWLVRVVKDSSIGYLPAEHIETPTERLARLNKHRNIDLSATMLTDQDTKSRNPLKSAIKRRKTKTVQFAAPTYVDYVDYSDNEFSSAEEDLGNSYFAQQQQQGQQAKGASQQSTETTEPDDETAKVEPLRPRSQQKDAKAESRRQDSAGEADVVADRGSDESHESRAGDGPKKTSDGTVRDSFFRDDTVETKKITLTPNLLRDDTALRTSSDSRELKQGVSLDKLDKDSLLGKDDKKKKDKKEKEKKPSAIRSFFSRKDKKAKGDEDDDSFGKRSLDADVQEKDVEEEELHQSPDKGSGLQRNPSKLQKQQPRTDPSPTRKANIGSAGNDSAAEPAAYLSGAKVNNVANVPPSSMRVVDPEPRGSPKGSPRDRGVSWDRSPEALKKDEKPGNSKAPAAAASRAPKTDVRPQKTVKAKARVELDDFDSDEDIAPEPERPAPALVSEEARRPQQLRPVPGAYPDSYQSTAPGPAVTTPYQQTVDRLSESPVQVSPVTTVNPPPLIVDSSSQEEDRSSSRSTLSPELIEHEDGDSRGKKDSISTSTSTTESWNDVNLRAFFDSGSDIRDLLVVVYDKTDVAPAGPEHPVAGGLFREQNAKLAEITTQLDNMLGDWLARKQRLRGTV
ncbi:hypothetical protein B0T22DRAFT_435844 [Podospora appendiculata]|uniref:SH3 domain-containing protein n=1 Tax=Podospora appendiculata TaxID=314037 RepID=A0AAE0XFM7_9PEZI|nr:hypothetical protein B0T22DRAFT_435844 [Podospora appendiculata]